MKNEELEMKNEKGKVKAASKALQPVT